MDEMVLHVEVCQHASSTQPKHLIEAEVRNEFREKDIVFDTLLYGKDCENSFVLDHVQYVVFSSNIERKEEKMDASITKFHIYRLTREGAATETMSHDSGELSVASHWLLPSQEFHNLWENLYYDCDIKTNLLRFVETIMLFSEHAVDPNIISCNKVILLHGPPGTGKTSMCKALAQKMAIRMGHRFTHGELIEINSHSLFSKWFSESGKLVMKLFDDIKSMVQNEKALICILIDEVESLAHARKSCINGSEPSDSIRVVNALLTQLDQIKRYPNVFILTTSNMTEAIDLAFVDRADIKQYLGYPCTDAIYNIYRSCLKELMRSEIVEYDMLVKPSQIDQFAGIVNNSSRLWDISAMSKGLTGRTLKKIPFLAYALHLPTSSAHNKITLYHLITAMHTAVIKQQNSHSFIHSDS